MAAIQFIAEGGQVRAPPADDITEGDDLSRHQWCRGWAGVGRILPPLAAVLQEIARGALSGAHMISILPNVLEERFSRLYVWRCVAFI